jgi:hypothetical protein
MFGMLTSTIKAASAVIDVPVAVVADTLTMGGVTTDKKGRSYTGDAAARFVENVKDIAEPD